MLIVVMGVSGSGKSTVGKMVASTLELTFLDADDFHSAHNIQKMHNGVALTDADRQPWLQAIAAALQQHEAGGAVLACSALKEAYRQQLQAAVATPISWILLEGSKEILLERLSSRKNHFMSAALLNSQLQTLEIPSYAFRFSILQQPRQIAAAILKILTA